MGPRRKFRMRDDKFCCVFLAALSVTVSTGCAPALIPLEKQEMARLRSEPQIQVVTYQPPRFIHATHSDAFLAAAVFGPAIILALVQGQAIPQAYSLEDPAAKVKAFFLKGLVGHLDVTHLSHVQDVLTDDGILALKKRLGSGVVLDFKTEHWGVVPVPFSFSLYQIQYQIRSRLVHVSDDRVLWQGYCRYDGKDSRATLDDLKTSSGYLLKEKFREAAESCGEILLTQLFEKQP